MSMIHNINVVIVSLLEAPKVFTNDSKKGWEINPVKYIHLSNFNLLASVIIAL